MSAWRNRVFLLRAASLLAVLAAMALPPITVTRPVYTLIAVLDITMSMNVRDQSVDGAPASRIAAEKRAIHTLLTQLPCGSHLGMAIFVERVPFLLFEPVETCANFPALDAEIEAIDWRMGWDSESHIAAALLASLRMARGLGADLIFMTDGQESPPLAWDGAPNFAGVAHAAHGVIVGVGGHEFSPIPKYDNYGREIGVYKAGDVPSETAGLFRGREHLSAVDEPHLRSLAAATGLEYRHLESGLALFPAYFDQARPVLRREPERLNWVFGGLALFLAFAASLEKGWGRCAIPPRPPVDHSGVV